MDDPNLEQGGASEEALELELEPEVTPEEEPKELGDDPLDEISDLAVRTQAKKDRAIARRLAKKEETPAPKPDIKPDTSQFLTKADFFKSNERKAIREITADAEIKASWNEIIPFYTPRRGKETPEDIAEDIRDAVTLWKARNPEVVTDDSKNELTATPVIKTGGGSVDKTTPKPKDPPNYKEPSSVTGWYPKKKV